MTYKIIGDSCLDLPRELKDDPHFQMIPLTLQVGSASIIDDETFDRKSFWNWLQPALSALKRPVRLRIVLKRLMNVMWKISLLSLCPSI